MISKIEHPLEMLSTEEISLAYEIYKTSEGYDEATHFSQISLVEPLKEFLKDFKSGDPFEREVKLIGRDSALDGGFIATINLSNKTLNVKRVSNSAQVQYTVQDIFTAMTLLKEHPDYQAAMKKRGITDMEKVQIDVLSRKILIRVGVQLGLKFFRKKLMAFIPGIGIALSGGVNFLGTRQVGKLGIDFFRNKAEFIRVHGQSSTNLEVTKRAALQMMVNLCKMGEKVLDSQKTVINDAMDIFGYSEKEQSAVMSELDNAEITPIAIKDIRRMTDDDRRYVLKQGLKILEDSVSTKQENYLEFITRAFGLTQTDLKKIRDQIKEDA